MKVGPNQKKVPEKKSKKKILVSHTSSTPHMGVFQKKSFFFIEKKNLRKKNRPTGGSVVPQGGLQGGVVPQGGCRGV